MVSLRLKYIPNNQKSREKGNKLKSQALLVLEDQAADAAHPVVNILFEC